MTFLEKEETHKHFFLQNDHIFDFNGGDFGFMYKSLV